MAMFPTIHMNGTPRQHLEDGLGNVGFKLQQAIDALQQAGPNARDYYPQGDDAFGKAAAEHKARVDALRAVYREIEEIFSAIGEK